MHFTCRGMTYCIGHNKLNSFLSHMKYPKKVIVGSVDHLFRYSISHFVDTSL